jgi:DNA gyrase subunit B
VPYQYFKSTIYEKRIEMYHDKTLIRQIIDLERNIDTGKIDHPDGGCFTGDTKVKLVDGRSLSFLELVDEYNNNKTNYVYSINLETNKIEAKPILKAWKTLENQPLVKLTFDNGEAVECTLNHRFMLRDGSYIEAQDLLPGDSLMPLYTKYPSKGGLAKYRLYYEPFEDKWHFEHRAFAKEIIDEKHLVHHRDCNPNNNSPENLVWCSKSQHQKIHAEMQTEACSKEAIEKKSRSLTQRHEENKKSEVYALRAYKTSQSLLKHNLEKYGHNKTIDFQNHIKEIEETFNVKWDELTVNEKNSYGVKLSRINNPEIQEKVTANVIKNHKLGKYQKAKKALSEHNQHTKELKRLFPNIDKEMFINMFGFEYDSIEPYKKGPWTNRYRQKLYDLKNHKVVSIEFIEKCEDVYDIEVADNHNFALAAGIFVHNSKDVCDAVCGSIFNASRHAEQFAYEYGESAEQLLQINSGDDYDDVKQLTLSMEEELKKVNGILRPNNMHPSDAQKKTELYSLYDDIIIL